MEEELITILSRNKHKEQTPFPLGGGQGERLPFSLIEAGLQKNPDKKYLLELRQQLLESATWKKS